jgi:hypothetical protein
VQLEGLGEMKIIMTRYVIVPSSLHSCKRSCIFFRFTEVPLTQGSEGQFTYKHKVCLATLVRYKLELKCSSK